MLQIVCVEVEERAGTTGGETGELDEGLVEVDQRLCPPERILTERRLCGAEALSSTRREVAAGRIGRDDADECPEGAVAGLRPSVEI